MICIELHIGSGGVTLDYSYIDDFETDWVQKYLTPPEQSTDGKKLDEIEQNENSQKISEHAHDSKGDAQTVNVRCAEKETVTIKNEKQGRIGINVKKISDDYLLPIFELFILLWTWPILLLLLKRYQANGWGVDQVQQDCHPISFMVSAQTSFSSN